MGTPFPSRTMTRMRFLPTMATAPVVPREFAKVGGRLLDVALRLRAAAAETADVADGTDGGRRAV